MAFGLKLLKHIFFPSSMDFYNNLLMLLEDFMASLILLNVVNFVLSP